MRMLKNVILLTAVAWIVSLSVTSYAAKNSEPEIQPQVQSTGDRFNKSDLNGNGFITRDEFAASNHLSSSNPTSDKDIRAIRIMAAFQEMDQDDDKEVSKIEYKRYMEKIGG
jgi:Ca2+-binding EF-hand superfamily protein